MNKWPVAVIPNCIDTKSWRPIAKTLARELMGLPAHVPLILFGAIGGTQDLRKGFDLLLDALDYLYISAKEFKIELAIFGQLAPKESTGIGFPVHYLGHLSDDVSLQLLYSAVDLLVIPSRQDNLPNTGLEALACGTPVVAFDICGLADVVTHLKTGYLAKSFEPKDLANGMLYVLDRQKSADFNVSARLSALNNFDNNINALKYYEIYKELLIRPHLK
jgi:glycosyltransferase involved in cell wall biosynthesis